MRMTARLTMAHPQSLVVAPTLFFQWATAGRSENAPTDPRWAFVEARVNGYRNDHLDYLRRESRRLRAEIDLHTLCALLVGRVEFRYRPENVLLQSVWERIWHTEVQELLTLAVRDYFITGVGGLALTPFGLGIVRAETAVAYPNWFRPEWIARLVILPVEKAVALFGPKVRRYRPKADAGLDPQNEESVPLAPEAIPALELYDGKRLLYLMAGREVGQVELGGRYGYFVLLGEERVYDESSAYRDPALDPLRFSPLLNETGFIGLERYLRSYRDSYLQDWEASENELPVSLLERCVRSRYYGYNLYEAHEKLVESFLKESLKGRWAFYRFDVFDTESEAFQQFEALYNAIGYNADDPLRVPPVQFAGGVNLQEIQIGLRELEGLITSITGVSPYMLGVVGVTRVASEVVASQQHTNVKLSVLQEQIAQMLSRFVRAYQLYLATLPESEQTVWIESFEAPDGTLQYARIGPLNRELSALSFFEEFEYLEFFTQSQIELAYTGQLSLVERRQNYMQALQLLGSMLQVLMQTGENYRLTPIVDRLLKDFGVNLHEVKTAPATAPTPAPAPTMNPTMNPMMNPMMNPTMMASMGGVPSSGELEGVPTPIEVPPDLAAQLVQQGVLNPEEAASLVNPETGSEPASGTNEVVSLGQLFGM